MKKALLIFASAAMIISCKRLGENEYEISGKVDPSLNGKSIVLEKPGGYMGSHPIDTAKVENGKFVFKGTTTEPSMHFISMMDSPQNGRTELILEPGEIEMEINKDTISFSKRSGTFNNDLLQDYQDKVRVADKKAKTYMDKNRPAYMDAMQKQDTVTMNRLTKELQTIGEEKKKAQTEFFDKNPDAYINLFIIREMAQGKTGDELMAMYNKLGSKLKKSKDGKELLDQINKYKEQEAQMKQGQDAAKTASEAVSVGKIAPDFSAPGPNGKMISLKQSLGKVTIIDFWASWCGPCRKENPNVVALYNDLHSKGLNIIGVSLDQPGQADKWKQAIAADKLTWTHVSNLKHWQDPIARQYGITGIPATFILDAKGVIVAKDLRGAELRSKVSELLKG